MSSVRYKNTDREADFFTDLEDISSLPKQKFDCIIATQVLMYMNDPVLALRNLKSMLKPNGSLIVTVPGPLFHFSRGTHQTFCFTEDSLKFIYSNVFKNSFYDIRNYGNLQYAIYMLFWYKKNPIHYPIYDEIKFTLVIGITAKKIHG